MRRFLNLILPVVLVAVAIGAAAVPARAASSGVQDGGSFFSKDAVAQANDLIRDIRSIDNRDVLVVTFAAIPADRQEQFKSKSEQGFYGDWIEEIGKENGVNGVVILLNREPEPAHLQVEVGSKTRQHSFTVDDRNELRDKMLALLKEKQYDNALLDGLRFIKEKMKRANAAAAAQNSQTAPPYSNSPGYPSAPIITPPHSFAFGFPIGAMLCVGVAILIAVFVIIKIATGNRGYGGGYGAPPPGGYPPGYSGGYGYGGGGGGGFGRGLLGGLLGGALGAWGYDRFNQSNNTNYNPPPPAGGGDFGASSDQTDTSYSSTGGDFGSSSSPDSSSSGGDFGSSADSSSSSDFGGGGGGGDFGSGGGDSGGGSTGGDF